MIDIKKQNSFKEIDVELYCVANFITEQLFNKSNTEIVNTPNVSYVILGKIVHKVVEVSNY